MRFNFDEAHFLRECYEVITVSLPIPITICFCAHNKFRHFLFVFHLTDQAY